MSTNEKPDQPKIEMPSLERIQQGLGSAASIDDFFGKEGILTAYTKLPKAPVGASHGRFRGDAENELNLLRLDLDAFTHGTNYSTLGGPIGSLELVSNLVGKLLPGVEHGLAFIQ